jgi:ABC-2 type transport system permease protein
MTTLVGQIKLETKLFLRDKRSLFFTFAFPVIMVLIFGAAFGNQTVAGLPAINYLLPGIIVMALMMVTMNNNVTKITSDRERGIYRRLSLTPLKRQTLLTGQIIVRYLIVIASTLLLITIGYSVFKAHIGGNQLLFLTVLTLGVLTFTALGFAMSSLVKNTNSAMALCMAVLFPLMFLGGCFWTLDQMPHFLNVVANVLPTTHLNAALRMITLQGAGFNQIWHELPVIMGWLAGSSVLAIKFFKWE